LREDEIVLNFGNPVDMMNSLPPDFTLSTNHHSYALYFAVMSDVCGTLRDLSPAPQDFHIDVDDPTGLFDKFARLFRGERITLLRDERKFHKTVTDALGIGASFPPWMLRRTARLDGYPDTAFLAEFGSWRMPKSCDFVMKASRLHHVLLRSPHFRLRTSLCLYNVSQYSLTASSVLLETVRRNPDLGEIRIEVEDDGEFRQVVELLNCQWVRLTQANVAFLYNAAIMLGIQSLVEVTGKFVEKVAAAQEKVENGTSLMARLINLQDRLLEVSEDEVELAVAFAESWLRCREDTRELVEVVCGIVDGRPERSPVFARLLRRLLEKYDNAGLLSIVRSKVLHDRPGGGFFAYHLWREQLIDVSAIVRLYRMRIGNRAPSAWVTANSRLGLKGKDMFVWFLPELVGTFPKALATLIDNPSAFNQWQVDDWRLFKEHRHSGTNPDEFARAVRSDDVDKLQKLLEGVGFDYNHEIPTCVFDNSRHRTLLAYAARWRAIGCVRFLILNGAAVGMAALEAAIQGGHAEIIRLIDDRIKAAKPRKQPAAGGPAGNTWGARQRPDDDVIGIAIRTFRSDVCEWLLETGRGKEGIETYAITAARCGNIRCFAMLLDRGLPLRFTTAPFSFTSMLQEICRHGFASLMALILSLGDGLPQGNAQCRTKCAGDRREKQLLTVAARSGSMRAVESVLKTSAAAGQGYYQDAMKKAAKHGHLDVLRFLEVRTRADRVAETHLDECLNLAIIWRNPDVIDYLLPRLKTHGKSLGSCCRLDDQDLVKALVARVSPDADFTQFFATGLSFGSENVVKWFLHNKAKVQFEELSTSLFDAESLGFVSLAKLVFAAASEQQRRKLARQSISRAVERGTIELIHFFGSVGEVRGTLLIWAVRVSNIDVVKALVTHNSSREFLNAQSKDGTPLCLAIRNERTDIALFLLSCPEIDPSIHDLTLDTPLVHAARCCNVPVVQAITALYGSRTAECLTNVNRAITKAMKFSTGLPHAVGWDGTWALPYTADVRLLQERIILCLLSVPGVNANLYVKEENLFLFAARIGSILLIRRLLELPKTNVNEYNQRGTALMIALEQAFVEIALILIECTRVDLNFCGWRKQSALHAAVQGDSPEALRALVECPRFEARRHDVSAASFHFLLYHFQSRI
jgi:ankyrin repeat protein